MWRKYRKLPVVIDACRFGTADTIPDDFPVRPAPENKRAICRICNERMSCHGTIETLEGTMLVCPGDWIIRGVNCEIYPCKPEIFEKTYELTERRERWREKVGGMLVRLKHWLIAYLERMDNNA